MNNRKSRLTWSLAIPAVFLFSSTALLAQANGAEAAETSSTTFLQMVAQGGWAMWPLGLLSIAGLALIAYNFYALRTPVFFDDETEAKLRDSLRGLNLEEAQTICEESPSALNRILGHGLESVRDNQIDLDLFKERVESGSTKELSGPFVIINYLSVIASIAPMLGLLGTVSGMVKAFNAIADVGMGQPDVLAGNISEALITTATGMLIGIPAMFFFFYFKNVYAKIVAEMTMRVGDMQAELVHASR